jgi:membrane associated rhomboid family serine protease
MVREPNARHGTLHQAMRQVRFQMTVWTYGLDARRTMPVFAGVASPWRLPLICVSPRCPPGRTHRKPFTEVSMPITLLIILAATCIVSFMAFSNRRLIDDLILWPPAIERKREYYRLVTYGFIHADGMHLLFNMLTLYFAGTQMEPFYNASLGAFGFGLFYLGGLIVSILPTYLKNRHNTNYRSLGASGAVSAVLFGFIMLSPWSRILVLFVPMPAIVYALLYVGYSVYMDHQGRGNINHSAHLWGAAYGVVFTVLANPAVLPHFLGSLSRPGM